MRWSDLTVVVVAAVAATGCGTTETTADVQAQILLLQGDDEEGRWKALATLRTMGPSGAAAVPQMRTMLKATKDDVMRSELARALGGIGSGAAPAVPDLVPQLDSKDPWVRTKTAETLGTIGAAAATALPKLTRLAKDPDPDVAASAREAVQRIQRAKMR